MYIDKGSSSSRDSTCSTLCTTMLVSDSVLLALPLFLTPLPAFLEDLYQPNGYIALNRLDLNNHLVSLVNYAIRYVGKINVVSALAVVIRQCLDWYTL